MPSRILITMDDLETAVRLISEKGADALSVALLAREMGISRANVYYHFANREALIAAATAAGAGEELARRLRSRTAQERLIAAEAGGPERREGGMGRTGHAVLVDPRARHEHPLGPHLRVGRVVLLGREHVILIGLARTRDGAHRVVGRHVAAIVRIADVVRVGRRILITGCIADVVRAGRRILIAGPGGLRAHVRAVGRRCAVRRRQRALIIDRGMPRARLRRVACTLGCARRRRDRWSDRRGCRRVVRFSRRLRHQR